MEGREKRREREKERASTFYLFTEDETMAYYIVVDSEGLCYPATSRNIYTGECGITCPGRSGKNNEEEETRGENSARSRFRAR